MQTYIKGTFRRAIFHSDKGYTIGLFKVRETNQEAMEEFIGKTITFTGYFHDLNNDDTYLMSGELINHPRYGVQYEVSEYEKVLPDTKDGLIEFFSSNLFSNVGEKLAKKIVDTLGEDAITIILKDYNNLLAIKGMTEKKAMRIYSTLEEYQESEKTIIELTSLGFRMKDALMIYNRYKGSTQNKIQENIYTLIEDFDEITFGQVDGMRELLKISNDDDRRIMAVILYVMNTLNFENGNTYSTKEMIIKHVDQYLGFSLSEERYDYHFVELNRSFKIAIEEDRYYLIEYYQAERNISSILSNLSSSEDRKIKKLDSYFETLENYYGIKYNDRQKEAVLMALKKKLLVITGGPGTGKTTIIKAIVEIYRMIDSLDYETLCEEVALLAPTGRAAKRMSESTLMPASTIHRFLKWNQDTNDFAINEYNKAKVKFVIIDESSMIDTLLFDHLLKGLPNNVHIVIVGDYNQLPSVGPGQVLKDIIESETIPVVKLNLLYRQKDTSYIPILANEINENQLTDFKLPRSDYQFIETNNISIKQNIVDICKKALAKGYTYQDIQVLAPMYKGENGIDNINRLLQDIFNPNDKEKKEIKYSDVVFREQDKVIQLKNMPDDNVFNGDIGIIKYIKESFETESKKPEIHVDYDGNIVKYTPKEFINIKHAYAMSIHKSQGSEFKIVVIIVIPSHKRMLYRKLIYTGITRTKHSLIILGSSESFLYSVSNNHESTRLTGLKSFLHNSFILDHNTTAL